MLTARKKVSWTALAIMFLLVAVVAWLTLGRGFQQISAAAGSGQQAQAPTTPLAVQRLAAEHPRDFISYKDPELGFELKYPVGYEIALNPDPGVYLRIQARFPLSSSEVINLLVTNDSFTEKELNESFTEMIEAGEITSFKKTVVNGKQAFVGGGKTTSDLTDEIILIKHATFSCTAPQGNYTAFFSAAIPSSLASDLDVVDYMIYSFKC